MGQLLSNFLYAISWCSASRSRLKKYQDKLLSHIGKTYKLRYVTIKCVDDAFVINTLAVNEDYSGPNLPLVLVHGFSSGVAQWISNIGPLSENRAVFAIDLPGYGLSSRLKFCRDPEKLEEIFVETLEQWRQITGIQKFILLGHSMGGFVVSAYALKYPENVENLILAEPWGIDEYSKAPLWLKFVGLLYTYVDISYLLVAAGPLTPLIIMSYLIIMRAHFELDFAMNSFAYYFYNILLIRPYGETAMKGLSKGLISVKFPIIDRINKLFISRMTFIYGSYGPLNSSAGNRIKELMKGRADVDVFVVDDAGHYIVTDQPQIFNRIVYDACMHADHNENSVNGIKLTNGTNGAT